MHTAFKKCIFGSLQAETMRFIAQNTSIPIPKAIDHWAMCQDGGEAIVMEWSQGNTLETVSPSLNDVQKSCLVEQLQGYISELRSLR
jgi:aminoglycoside phosphotransferase (APT) family kinase protein